MFYHNAEIQKLKNIRRKVPGKLLVAKYLHLQIVNM